MSIIIITNRTYYVRSPLNDSVLDCGSRNVIYLTSCGKCGLQYVGKTSQTLRSRLNNHRNRLKQLCDLYLYNHFNSDGHSITDLNIMPIEEVVLTADDNLTLVSKLLTREEHWIKELGSYGLNDNIRNLGTISKTLGQGLVVYSVFNKHHRKYRNKSKVYNELIQEKVKEILLSCKSAFFTNSIRTYIQCLPRRKLLSVLCATEEVLLTDRIAT